MNNSGQLLRPLARHRCRPAGGDERPRRLSYRRRNSQAVDDIVILPWSEPCRGPASSSLLTHFKADHQPRTSSIPRPACLLRSPIPGQVAATTAIRRGHRPKRVPGTTHATRRSRATDNKNRGNQHYESPAPLRPSDRSGRVNRISVIFPSRAGPDGSYGQEREGRSGLQGALQDSSIGIQLWCARRSASIRARRPGRVVNRKFA